MLVVVVVVVVVVVMEGFSEIGLLCFDGRGGRAVR